MPVRKGLPTVEGTLGTQEERLRALEVHQHDELPDGSTGGGGKEYATVVIACANTHPSGQAQADFVCSGGGDESTLFAAAQSLPDSGGEIVILEGTMVINTDRTLPKGNIHLRGMGYATVIESRHFGDALNLGGSNCRVSSLRLRRQGGAATGTGIDVDSSVFTDIAIDDCWFEGFSAGIEVRCVRTVISRCRFDGADEAVHHGNSNAVDGALVDSVARNGNKLIDCSANRWRIANNLSVDQAQDAIEVTGEFQSIIGNIVENPGGIGLDINASDSSIIGNVIRSPGDIGINSGGGRNVCNGNRVEDGAGDGINCGAGDSVISGNLVRTCVKGIVIADNNVAVVGNVVQTCNQHGIELNGGDDCSILSNTVYCCGLQTNVTYDGIFVTSNADRTNIQGNTVRQCGGGFDHRYGLNIATADCNDTLATNNDLKNSGTTGSFNDAGTGTITTAGNRL